MTQLSPVQTCLDLTNFDSTTPIDKILNTSSIILPVKLSFNDQRIITDSSFKESTSPWEMVVFSDLSIASLMAVLARAKLSSCVLTAVNTRRDKTSFRFQIDALSHANKQLATEIALNSGFEIAFIKDAPSLNNPGLLVMDMDSTTIEIECIDEIAKLAGVGEQVSEVTERAMCGELDFAESLRARVAALKDAPESILAEVGNSLPLMSGLEILVQTLHKHQWKVAVASGGFTYYTEILKSLLQLDATQANVLEIAEGKLTGKVIGNITDAQVKADTLTRLAAQYQITGQQTVAMGDGANDLIMMDAANLGVAYKAKPVVLQQASCSINFSGLDCLLHWLK